MITISLCMIVKDEEKTLKKCLESIHDLVDEIVIVDTGSRDQTKKIASEFTDKLYDFRWQNDFSIARNFSFSKATKEYVMWMDADDILLENDRLKFQDLKKNFNKEIDVVIMKYQLGKPNDDQIYCSFVRERIVRRSKHFKWKDPVHEYLDFTGKYFNSDIAITHKKEKIINDRNLKIFEEYIKKGNELTHRNFFYYARELFRAGEYKKAAHYYKKFLKQDGGLLSNYMDSCIDLSHCYLILKQEKKALEILAHYFSLDIPRAEICCKIAYIYKEKKEYQKAIKWFITASQLEKPSEGWNCITHENYDYIPFMELTSCYYRMGKIDEAIYYNEKAAEIRPTDKKIIHNRIYLAEIKKKISDYQMK